MICVREATVSGGDSLRLLVVANAIVHEVEGVLEDGA